MKGPIDKDSLLIPKRFIPIDQAGELDSFYSNKHWFVGYVKYCHEQRVADKLVSMGVEYYLPMQKRKKQWSDRVKTVNVMIMPRYIFIRCKPSERIPLIQEIYDLKSYMMDKANHTPVIIRDDQMDKFRKMVDYETLSVVVDPTQFEPGEMVEVVCGPLAGQVLELIDVNGTKCIALGLGILGTARMEIPLSYVEKVNKKTT